MGRNALKERWNLLDIFIQHPTSKRFLFIQKEILRCRIPKKIFDIFKNYILYFNKIILSDEVWSLELFIREEFKLQPRAGKQQPATK